MDLLLDTHAFIWFMNGDNQPSTTVRSLIADTTNKCFLTKHCQHLGNSDQKQFE
jgi:PIN domain nuclease of toxin-antitoxin system